MSVEIVELLKEPRMVKVCAPMVRYSKVQFRTLVRKYGCDICFTPMIIADSFVQSSKARDNEFTTHADDKPLIVQFAAKNSNDFVLATEMVAPYCNGVDLNCGCPQRWAMKEGYGAHLLKNPQLIKDSILQVKNRIPRPFTVSVKIRLLKDMKKTISLCKDLESAGVSFISVHARTPEMRHEPIDLESLKLVRDCVQLPLIANGDVKNFENATALYNESKCEGIMSARGILTNPALFAGYPVTPLNCIQDWLDITSDISIPFSCFHHHLIFMLEKLLPKQKREYFNCLQTKKMVLEFLDDYYGIKPNYDTNYYKPIVCDYNLKNFDNVHNYKCIKNTGDDIPNDFLGNIFEQES